MIHTNSLRLYSILAAALCFACEETTDSSVTDKPEKPTADLAETVCASPAPISGTKQSSTAIWINGVEVVPLDEKAAWNASVEMMEGTNTLTIVAKSATGQESDSIRKNTTLDLTQPAKPTVTGMIPAVVMERMFTISGEKEAGAGISIDGMVAVPPDESTMWTAQVMLMPGPNTVRIEARDSCRASEVVELDIFQDDSGIGLSVDDPMSPTCDDSQVITGKRAPGVAVLLNDTLIIEAGDETTWTHTVALNEGKNTLEFVGQIGTNISLPHTVEVEYDSTAPSQPEIPAAMLPGSYTSNPDLMLSGTKEANSAILVNDDEVVMENAETTFMFSYTLSAGQNFIQIDARDFCGRTSGNPIVATVTLDTTMPALTILSPMAGDTLTGLALIEGEATDNTTDMNMNGVAAIDVAVDGQALTSIPLADTSTFSVAWDTTQVADGSHVLTITAIDIAGNSSTPVTMIVEVANLARIVSDDPPPMEWGSDPSRASSNRPAVAVTTNGAIGVVWRDNVERAEEGTDRDIYLRLYGTGSAMSVIETVSNFVNPVLDGNSENVSVSPASNGGLHIVWQDDGALDQDTDVESDIYYRNHDGQSLGTNALLVSQSSMGAGSGPDEQDYRSIYPDVAVDGRGIAHVVWQDNGDLDGDGDTDYDIYYASGGSAGFNQPTLISDALPGLDGVSVRPRIAVTPDNCPHVVWQDDGQIDMSDTDMNRDIYYRGSTPNMAGGCTWGPIVLISEENGFDNVYRPRIAADPADSRGLLYITWHGSGNVINNGTDIDVFMANFFVPQTPAGRGSLILLSDDINDGRSTNADVAIDSLGNVHASWEDAGDINGAGTDLDIYMRTWNGSMFSPYASISDIGMNSVNQGISIEPSMAVDGTQLIMVWEDNSDYDGDMIDDDDILMIVR
ncbi:MAG: Ig-like domain-containing protein [Myxococcota bacterium]|nr:Ig-like domain-containing protein [Myxococcota bacterium]